MVVLLECHPVIQLLELLRRELHPDTPPDLSIRRVIYEAAGEILEEVSAVVSSGLEIPDYIHDAASKAVEEIHSLLLPLEPDSIRVIDSCGSVAVQINEGSEHGLQQYCKSSRLVQHPCSGSAWGRVYARDSEIPS